MKASKGVQIVSNVTTTLLTQNYLPLDAHTHTHKH